MRASGRIACAGGRAVVASVQPTSGLGGAATSAGGVATFRPGDLAEIRKIDAAEAARGRRIDIACGAIGIVAGCIAGAVAWDMSELEWAERHTWTSACQQYALHTVMRYVGRKQLRRLISDAEDGEVVQRRLLTQLLSQHESMRDCTEQGVPTVTTLEEFRSRHPICRCRGVVRKPDVSADLSDSIFYHRGFCVAVGVIGCGYPFILSELRRYLKLSCTSPCPELARGNDSYFAVGRAPGFAYVSPPAVYNLKNSKNTLYAQALLALGERDLTMIETDCPDIVNHLMDLVKKSRRSLVQDLRNGHVWDRKVMENAPSGLIRDEIDGALAGPGAKRAAEIDKLLRKGAGAAELWPNLQVVVALNGASSKGKCDRLRERLGPKIKVHTPYYTTAAGLTGLNIFPEDPFGTPAFVLDPECIFFELLPTRWSDCEQPPANAAVLPWEAEVGELYEIVATTREGLCRCRLGDIVRVVARFGQMPVVTVEDCGRQ